MPQIGITLKQLWREQNFKPNDNQKDAILHTDGPLFLPAGPGSGKTRVLLWRTLNLIVFHGVKPEEIFLSTFTEKAALQLKEGLRALLGMVTSLTNTPCGLSRMKTIFAVQSCRNCDARFSCSAYRAYAQTSRVGELTSSRGAAESTFRQLFFDDYGTEEERNERVMAGLEVATAIVERTT